MTESIKKSKRKYTEEFIESAISLAISSLPISEMVFRYYLYSY